MCVRARVDVESQVSASRLISTHTLGNGDKVSNLVHNVSFTHFKGLWRYIEVGCTLLKQILEMPFTIRYAIQINYAGAHLKSH